MQNVWSFSSWETESDDTLSIHHCDWHVTGAILPADINRLLNLFPLINNIWKSWQLVSFTRCDILLVMRSPEISWVLFSDRSDFIKACVCNRWWDLDLQLWRETPVSYQYLHIPPSSSPLVQDEITGYINRYLRGLWICRGQERSKKQWVGISRHNILPTCQYFLKHSGRLAMPMCARIFFHLKAENITLLKKGNNMLLCPFFKGRPAGSCRPGKIRKLLSQMTLSLY